MAQPEEANKLTSYNSITNCMSHLDFIVAGLPTVTSRRSHQIQAAIDLKSSPAQSGAETSHRVLGATTSLIACTTTSLNFSSHQCRLQLQSQQLHHPSLPTAPTTSSPCSICAAQATGVTCPWKEERVGAHGRER
ncbi:hypothetical protein M0R45_007636 [Rubus argutus]|uniref:Uncharacterized protein n=1 Tax=Rubus argutus TaxID=59490 RepID=A0AAW1XYT8_RUBAR